jgi:hypothetical protein
MWILWARAENISGSIKLTGSKESRAPGAGSVFGES